MWTPLIEQFKHNYKCVGIHLLSVSMGNRLFPKRGALYFAAALLVVSFGFMLCSSNSFAETALPYHAGQTSVQGALRPALPQAGSSMHIVTALDTHGKARHHQAIEHVTPPSVIEKLLQPMKKTQNDRDNGMR